MTMATVTLHPPDACRLLSLMDADTTGLDDPQLAVIRSRSRAFSGKVDTGFPQKMRSNKEARALSDSIQSESVLSIAASSRTRARIIEGDTRPLHSSTTIPAVISGGKRRVWPKS